MRPKRTEWAEDEEFSGDSQDYPRWRADWQRRAVRRKAEQYALRDLLLRRAAYRRGLAPSQLRRIDAMRHGTKVNRRTVYERDGGICQLCLLPVELADLAIDHIVPLAHGGTHCPQNVQATHRLCNMRKGARLNYTAVRTP